MNIKTKLRGAFDLLFLFGRGINAFPGTKESAIRSIILPLAILPLSLLFACLYPPKGMESGYSTGQIITTMIAQGVISFIFSMALVLGLAKGFKKADKFWLFFEACNWVGLAVSIATLPLTAAAVFHWIPREEMDRVFVIVQCYLYVVTACIAYRSFQLNWQLAGFTAIAILFADQTTWTLLYQMQGIARPW